MVSRLARPLLVTGIAVAPARQAPKGSGSSGGRAPAPAALRQRTWTAIQARGPGTIPSSAQWTARTLYPVMSVVVALLDFCAVANGPPTRRAIATTQDEQSAASSAGY